MLDTKLSIQWHIITLCNNLCSYCTYKKNRGVKKAVISSKKDIYTALTHIYNMDRPEYEFRFMGSGGEPTLHPHLYEILCYIEEKFEGKLSKNGNWILTNGVKSLEYFQSIRTPNITYHFSIHPEFTKNDHVIELLENLSAESAVHINIMYLPKLRDKCRDLVSQLEEHHKDYVFTSRIVYVRDEPNFTQVLPSYTNDDLEYVKEKNLVLREVSEDENKYWEIDDYCEGTFCVQGANVMRINEYGQYSGSSCMLAKYSDESLFQRKLKGKISDNISVGQCNQLRCASDIHMSRGTKYYSLNEAEDFVKEIKNSVREY